MRTRCCRLSCLADGFATLVTQEDPKLRIVSDESKPAVNIDLIVGLRQS